MILDGDEFQINDAEDETMYERDGDIVINGNEFSLDRTYYWRKVKLVNGGTIKANGHKFFVTCLEFGWP
jgi:hypothetical protein